MNKNERTISGETMTDVVKFVPREGFKLTDDILNTEYTTIAVEEIEFNGNKSFTITMEDKDGKVVNLSAAALKKARILSKADAAGTDTYKDTENIFVRSNAEEIWSGSAYFHTQEGMKADTEFVVPEKIKLRYAILAEDQETQKPMVNPFLYKGYRKVVEAYQENGSFPTMEDFKEELLKSKAEGRINGLPEAMTTPTLQNWVKEDVQNYRHTLIIEDFEN